MALFPFCKTPSDFLQGRKAAVRVAKPHPLFHFLEADKPQETSVVTNVKQAAPQIPQETPWGAPLVWGDSRNSAWRRAKFAQRGVRTGLLSLVVGTYARFIRRFLSSAETYFLSGQMVTYYILTDNPRCLDPAMELGPGRELQVVQVAELPGWDKLAYRRMSLLVEAIRNHIGREVEYLYCADIDQEFVAPVGEEILGDLVATLHPELYGMPRNAFPYEVEETSSACVEEDEGDYYYTSELYGGLVSQVFKLAKVCSLLILQDQAKGVMARGLEESYLNRYLIDHRPTCVLSPEYSCWDSALTADVPMQRLISLGRQCEASDMQMKERYRC
ncbi:globoside alpha-1,3-N-acetylgalactosaminyltransferase 1-like isoform X2 [Cheilinus undulatus]|uniref:globoside alpha-1,3-N-acetylgalactosaminyltransferase 1-like isoform X2 n=1 Tax=Cheilinus undulatus TaxID=241271 RepID=UPI001BD4AE7A|nr:globoside alpha-1,3-N-acetylgalactosaminyltransferase 1-like isoform X2 [Cheilinus undulatus]